LPIEFKSILSPDKSKNIRIHANFKAAGVEGFKKLRYVAYASHWQGAIVDSAFGMRAALLGVALPNLLNYFS